MTANQVFKALADPTRRRVLELLKEGPQTAGQLADRFPVSKPTMSAHFAVLQEAGLVEAQKDGRAVLYRLKMSVLEDALLGFVDGLGIGTAGRAAKRKRTVSGKQEA
jgi:DNA-binding transcriptional ArsR family regulator